MSVPSFFLLGVLTVSLSCIYVVYYRYLHPLAGYPGPFVASLTGLWKTYQVGAGDFEKVLLALHQEHGKIVRIGPNHLDFSDASAVKTIYGAGKSFKKSAFYNAFTALRPNLFGVRDEEIHAARRRSVANGFSDRSISSMEPYVDACMLKLIARLDQAAEQGEAIDLGLWISFFVMDVLGELAFSRPFGVLESGDKDQMPPIRAHVLLATMSAHVPWLIPYVNRIAPYVPIPALQKMIRGRFALRQMAVASVHDAMEKKSDRKDLLGRLLEEVEAGTDNKGRSFDLVDVQTEAFGFIVAGSHTTATSTTVLLWYLLHNPESLKTLLEEVRKLPKPETASYLNHATRDMSYLNAARDEAFRISPVFVMPLPRIVPEGGKMIAGSFIPTGTEVSICCHALHHDETVFGPDLERFNPKRWLSEDYDGAPYLMPFGSGHRACIGRNLANVEMQKIVVSILARYEVALVGDADTGPRMVRTKSFGAAEVTENFIVKLTRR